MTELISRYGSRDLLALILRVFRWMDGTARKGRVLVSHPASGSGSGSGSEAAGIRARWRTAASIAAAQAAALALTAWAGAAAAHDTWFEARGMRGAGHLFMVLGTGNVYPVFEFPIGAEHLQRRGCRSAAQDAQLAAVANGSTWLLLKTRLAGAGPASCWAQLFPVEIELDAEAVRVYLEEARPPASVRVAWAAIQARGLPWKERYTKHARIVFNGEVSDGVALIGASQPFVAAQGGLQADRQAQPPDMGMDMVLVGNGRPLRPGDGASVQVLRDGRPLPGLAVELRHQPEATNTSTGVWLQTDDQGRVRLDLPTAGKWLLRGIDIRPSPSRSDAWDSRFVTLAFDVAPPAER